MVASNTKDKELDVYETARKLREDLIKSLESCSSGDQLEQIRIKYEKDKLKAPFQIQNLKASHSVAIQSLNVEINSLFSSKKLEFNGGKALGVTLSVVIEEDLGGTVSTPKSIDGQVNDILSNMLISIDSSEDTKGDAPLVDKTSATLIEKASPKESSFTLSKPSFDMNRESHLKSVRVQIQILRDKADYFKILYNQGREHKYVAAYNAALAVAKTVDDLATQYARKDISAADFKSQVKDVFDENNENIKTLNTHRGWKQFLVNVLAALLGGIFYIAGVVCTGRLMVFKPATDAQNKMNELARVVTEVEETDDTDEEDWEPETPSIGYEYN